MDILAKLFGSEARVRILRLFFLNPDGHFETSDIARKTKITPSTVWKELATLRSIGLIKKQQFYKETSQRGKILKKKTHGWSFDKTFRYSGELKNLLVSTDLVKKDDILDRFRKAGVIKLLVISGIFIKNDTSRLDILLVGDHLKRHMIENTLRTLEAEAGKELRYAILDTPEFQYRLSVYDKFVRDILDYPHETIIDRVGAEERV